MDDKEMRERILILVGIICLMWLTYIINAQPPAPPTNAPAKLSQAQIKALLAKIVIQPPPTNPPPPLSQMAWYACPPQQQWGVQFGILQSTRSMVPPVLWQDVAFAAADGTWHTNSFDPSNKPVYFRVVYGPITKTN